MESAYGHGIADVFLIAAPLALIAFLVTLFIKEVPLRTSGGLAQAAEAGRGRGVAEAPAAGRGASRRASASRAGPRGHRTGTARSAAEGTQRLAAVATGGRTGAASGAGSGGIPVRGYVRGAESAPVPQAAVTLISLAGRQLGRSVAQADGSYAVDAPGTGSYVLIASADGFQPQASTVVVNGEPVAYDILLSGTSGLTGAGAGRARAGCRSRTRWSS